MPEKMTVLKARMLIRLLEMEEPQCMVTQLAETFCVAKSTISRTADWCEENNMIKRGEGRSLSLTAHGKQLAETYRQKREAVLSWLLSEGVSGKSAEHDAMLFALSGSSESALLFAKLEEMRRLRERFRNRIILSGKEFCEALKDGSYSVPVIFYKISGSETQCLSLSMANEGFEHPGELVVKNGKGLIVLKAKAIEKTSILGGIKVKGTLQTLKYKEGSGFREAGKEGDTFYLPASSLSFLNINAKHVVQGCVELKMSCSVGKLHMPESSAIFTIFF